MSYIYHIADQNAKAQEAGFYQVQPCGEAQ